MLNVKIFLFTIDIFFSALHNVTEVALAYLSEIYTMQCIKHLKFANNYAEKTANERLHLLRNSLTIMQNFGM